MLSNGKQNGTRFFYGGSIVKNTRSVKEGACTKCYLLFDREIRLSRENTLEFDRYGRVGWIEDGLLFNSNFHFKMMENDSRSNCSISRIPCVKFKFPKEFLSLSFSLYIYISNCNV